MKEIFKNVGMITSFNDLRFAIDEIENYVTEQKQCDSCEMVDIKVANEKISEYHERQKQLVKKLESFINGCNRIIREYELSEKDYSNISGLIKGSNKLLTSMNE